MQAEYMVGPQYHNPPYLNGRNGMSCMGRNPCQRRVSGYVTYGDTMPSISPVQEPILENGMKEICVNTCEISQWHTPPSNRYTGDGELKAFVPIMNQLLSNGGESVVQNGLDGSAINYSTELEYSSNISNDWETMHPVNWSPNQVIEWLYSIFRKDYESVLIENFRSITGRNLMNMKKTDLISLLNNDNHADRIVAGLHHLLSGYEPIHPNQCTQNSMLSTSIFTPSAYEPTTPDYSTYIPHTMDGMCNTDYGQTRPYNQNTYTQFQNCEPWYNLYRSDNDTDSESGQFNSSLDPLPRLQEESQKPHRRGPGRPPREGKKNKKNGQRSSRLWEFIRDLLKDKDTCPRLVKWEDRDEGVFRFVQSDQVAKLWGERKSNPRMTYEKLSRAMRTYYHNKILEPVPKNGKYPKKLVYKFGPNATGWQN